MLISHKKQFVYLKTVKTAGTTIEIYFERYCATPARYDGPLHYRPALVTPDGVIGYRGPGAEQHTWFNHMPARTVRKQLGSKKWSGYFKFCAVRNPFDKVVSHFWFMMPDELRRRLARADFSEVKAHFSAWASPQAFPLDRHIYSIRNAVAVDDFIRYERLEDDVRRISRILGIPWRAKRLGRYKSDSRVRKEQFWKYHDARTRRLVGAAYRWELDYFGYECAGRS